MADEMIVTNGKAVIMSGDTEHETPVEPGKSLMEQEVHKWYQWADLPTRIELINGSGNTVATSYLMKPGYKEALFSE